MPQRLATKPLEKVWGSPQTEPWYRNPTSERIGEVWFTASDQTPLLVKFLFTSERLSVQVHPGDSFARAHENGSNGKTEMWHILRAEPGAAVAIGLKEPQTPERIRQAALSGEIVDLLRWVEVLPGDTFLIPAGTIHATGAGLAICEVQQVSDVTYRLFDYGRDRELHLEKSLAVASLKSYDALVPRRGTLLAECQYFRTERLDIQGTATLAPHRQSRICVVIAGEGTLAGEPFRTGEAWEIAAGEGPLVIESPHSALLITSRN